MPVTVGSDVLHMSENFYDFDREEQHYFTCFYILLPSFAFFYILLHSYTFFYILLSGTGIMIKFCLPFINEDILRLIVRLVGWCRSTGFSSDNNITVTAVN